MAFKVVKHAVLYIPVGNYELRFAGKKTTAQEQWHGAGNRSKERDTSREEGLVSPSVFCHRRVALLLSSGPATFTAKEVPDPKEVQSVLRWRGEAASRYLPVES